MDFDLISISIRLIDVHHQNCLRFVNHLYNLFSVSTQVSTKTTCGS